MGTKLWCLVGHLRQHMIPSITDIVLTLRKQHITGIDT